MKNTTLFLVQLPEARQDIIRQAAREVFPRAKFITTNTVAEAAQQPRVSGRQLLVMTALPETDISQTAQTMDDEGLPRWAVVVLGRSSSDLVESIPWEECNTTLLARVFRAAVLQHELLRENLRLRGDLKTIARRFNHDLRSPINCIHITCELIKELSNNAASLKAPIGVIQTSLFESIQIIESVSQVLNSSTEPLPFATLPMDAVVGKVLRHLEGKIQQAGTTVERPPNWPAVTGVAQWLEVIWSNLIVNALKHGQAMPIKLGWNLHQRANRFWVANQGTAVPEELRPLLFQRFDQLHTLPAPGLGLSVVQRLVSLQGGDCGYERLNDDSSLFYFTLPASE